MKNPVSLKLPRPSKQQECGLNTAYSLEACTYFAQLLIINISDPGEERTNR